MKKILLILFLISNMVFARHLYPEKYYQKKWCIENQGILEYRLHDDTRVDCLTKDYAVEFDFAPKWAESIGQSLYYSKVTGKKPAIVLIKEKNTDTRYIKRAQTLAQDYQINLSTMDIPEGIQEDEFDIYSIFNSISNLIKQIISLLKIFDLA